MAAASGQSFATLTHARLRAAQGDVGGARRILKVILAVQPGHRQARSLLDELERCADAAPKDAAASRIGRLSSWLQHLQEKRGMRDVR